MVDSGLTEGASRSSRHFLPSRSSSSATTHPHTTRSRNSVSSRLPSALSALDCFDPASQACTYSPRNLRSVCRCGNLKTSLLSVSHCISATLIELAFPETVCASFRNTTCSLLVACASGGLPASSSRLSSAKPSRRARACVARLLSAWTRQYMRALEYWQSLVESSMASRTRESSSMRACSFSNSLIWRLRRSRSLSSSPPATACTPSSSLCTEEFFSVMRVQSKRNTVSRLRLGSEVRLISFIRSYSKSFSFFSTPPCAVISYSQKKSSQEIRRNWSFSSMRRSIICVTALTGVSSGKGTAAFSKLQISSISLMLQCPQGQYPNSISKSTIPQDHTSALLPQTSPLSTSGAMQSGDPSEVCVKSSPPRSRLQKPKSASLRWPDLKKMLLGLISRWRMKFSCSERMAARSWRKSARASFSGRRRRARRSSSSVPPSQYSQTRQTQLLVLIISTNLTTLRFSSSTRSVSISLRASSASLPTSTNLSSATIFTATSMRVSMWKARKTFPYSPLPRQSVSVQLSTILTMAVTTRILYSLQHHHSMVQLPLLLLALALLALAAAQETAPDVPPAPPALKYYVFSEECYQTFFVRHEWVHVECIKRTVVKMLGYVVVVGAAIVKVPQIVKIVKKKSAFGVSFSSVVLETFTQLSAVAYNINRENPFSVYGETLFIAIQCALILLLFVIFADPASNKKGTYLATLLPVALVFYAALNPAYFPSYIIEHAMVAQMILFSGARLLQIYEIHRVKSTGSLSEITCTLTILGNIARMATALVEVAHDFLYGLSVFIALLLNGYILLSFLIFRSKPKVQEKKE